jgi:regulator of protease activity HflC (stomatin/prohibitin superfamily)
MKSIKSLFITLAACSAVALSAGCTRIETGEVGMRINFDKTISDTELQPGSWNQTLFGEVVTFPVKDIAVTLENKRPLTLENTALADFDLSVVYGINPASVAELYTQKSRSFHAISESKDTLLMYRYIETLVNNAAYKAVRQYKSLEVADNRAKIEQQIKDFVTEQLRSEKLDTSIHLAVVQVRNVAPDASILASASAVVTKENELRQASIEVEKAKKEAERMTALANQGQQSIAYMQAQAEPNISEGIKNGKVNTIIVPRSFTSYGVIGK